eukprot:jgi/Tetstr1/420347/TSEL_011467.t1
MVSLADVPPVAVVRDANEDESLAPRHVPSAEIPHLPGSCKDIRPILLEPRFDAKRRRCCFFPLGGDGGKDMREEMRQRHAKMRPRDEQSHLWDPKAPSALTELDVSA